MYFNQGLLGPDPEPNPEPAPEPNPAPEPAPEPEITPNLDPSLRTKKSAFFLRRLLHFHSTPFSAGVKEKNGQIISFLKMMNETCVPNPDPQIPHNYGSNRSESGTHASCKIFTIN